MKNNHLALPGFVLLLFLSACIQTEIIPEVLEPTLRLEQKTAALLVGDTARLKAVFTDDKGEDRSGAIQWQSRNTAFVSVSNRGTIKGIAPGQAWVIAVAPGNLRDSALISVVSDPKKAAKVEVNAPQNAVTVGGTIQFSAVVKNSAGEVLTGQAVVWSSSDAAVLSINTAGLANALKAGMAEVTATSGGIKSPPLGITVTPVAGLLRSGTFSGNSGYSVAGTATLAQNGMALKLSFGEDFKSSNGPGLAVFLAKNASGALNSQNSLKIADLKATSGAQEYAVPAGVKLADYDYVAVYCVPFNIRFGTTTQLK
jgi:Electron transfer DM13/Bacterial Ig-like domain (group 2)